MQPMPKCNGELVISPHICEGGYTPPPVNPPVNTVPIPSTLPLMFLGIAALAWYRKRK